MGRNVSNVTANLNIENYEKRAMSKSNCKLKMVRKRHIYDTLKQSDRKYFYGWWIDTYQPH